MLLMIITGGTEPPDWKIHHMEESIFEGYGDTGYYLGARFVRFVRFLLDSDCFDHIILYGIQEVREGFGRFLYSNL